MQANNLFMAYRYFPFIEKRSLCGSIFDVLLIEQVTVIVEMTVTYVVAKSYPTAQPWQQLRRDC